MVVTALEDLPFRTLLNLTPSFRTLVSVWDLRAGTWVRNSEERTLQVAGYLIISSSDSDLRVMDAFGNTLALLPRHRDAVTEMTGGGSGELVYTASMDGTVWAWKLVPSNPDRLVRYAREIAMTLPEDQRSLSADEQRALGLSQAKTWLNLGGAVDALMQWTRARPTK